MFTKFKLQVYKKYLQWFCRPARIKRYLNKIRTNGFSEDINKELKIKDNTIEESNSYQNDVSKNSNDMIKVAAIQQKINIYDDPIYFAEKIEAMVTEAVRRGASLVVFPEYNLMQLLGLLPGLSAPRDYTYYYSRPFSFNNYNNNNNNSEEEESKVDKFLAEIGYDFTIESVLTYIGPIIKDITQTVFSEIAKYHNVSIMTGSGIIPEIENNENIDQQNNCKLFNTAYLFSNNGELIGHQEKTHLLPEENEWGLTAGDQLRIFNTELGKLALPICMDATYFETFRILKEMGAEIVMVPIANPDSDYNYWTALRGIWSRVQESGVYGIKSAMVGYFLGFELTGQAGIYAPLELTERKDGIIAEASSHDDEEIVIASLNLDDIRQYQQEKDIDENREFWQSNFPGIYDNV